ncbi:hypothetical protein [Kitasatospora phosalacinea]|uniref:hypothetical protein n=1 Tax=Kitasatospora phosalacinea TaxID=2065 RepID=UPI000B1D8A3B|nr:hypothetical protein [Kitasatospora phosalacinea]
MGVVRRGVGGGVDRGLHVDGRASAVATILVLIGLGLSLLTTRLSGFTRMDSQQEGM